MSLAAPDPWLALLVFTAYFLIDLFFASYTLAIVEKRALRAANYAALIYLLLAIGVLNYTNNAVYMIPMALGSWAGTYLMIRWHNWKDASDRS